MDVSVIIVNYNTTTHLKNCLDSLLSFTSKYLFEVIVVDNNSPNRDIESIQECYPKVRFLFRDINDGFGSGCNYGSRYAEGKYLLFVNPDIIFLDNIYNDLFQIIEKNSSVDVISPIYVEDDGTKTYTYDKFPGYNWNISEAFGNVFSRLGSKFFPNQEPEKRNPFEVDWVMGSCIFIRSLVFRHVKGFDETFFLYYEDIDLQYRIKRLGYKIFYNPLTSVKHIKRVSVRTFNGENLYYYHMTRSNLIYMYKHYSFFKRNLIRVLHLVGIAIRVFTLPFRKIYSSKRKQKLKQYKTKFKQFLSSKDSIYKKKYVKINLEDVKRSQIVYHDKFWQR